MATKLSIFNEALRALGARRLANLTENTKNRNTLDAIWNLDGEAFGLIRRCLQEGFWNFAMRTSRIDFDPTVEPGFGYRFAFKKPDDYIKLAEMSLDEYFSLPLRQYNDEAGFWFLDNQQIYVRYISDDPLYGLNLGVYPPTFAKFVAIFMASEAAPTIAKGLVSIIEAKLKHSRINARSKDALEEPSKQPPPGSWQIARTLGSQTVRRDGGSRNTLLG